jgi:hypothetical protein
MDAQRAQERPHRARFRAVLVSAVVLALSVSTWFFERASCDYVCTMCDARQERVRFVFLGVTLLAYTGEVRLGPQTQVYYLLISEPHGHAWVPATVVRENWAVPFGHAESTAQTLGKEGLQYVLVRAFALHVVETHARHWPHAERVELFHALLGSRGDKEFLDAGRLAAPPGSEAAVRQWLERKRRSGVAP